MINELVTKLASDPFNPEINLMLAREYEALGQTAAAVSFYLRTAEYGYETHTLYAYNALLRMSKCFEAQNDRKLTVSAVILQAISLMPKRPEGYLLMSEYFVREQKWQEVYTWSMMGKDIEPCSKDYKELAIPVGYLHKLSFDYQIAASVFWLGQRTRSIEMFSKFLDNFTAIENLKNSALENLKVLNVAI